MADMRKAIATGYFIGCIDTVYASALDAYKTLAEYARMEEMVDIADTIDNMAESLYNTIALPCINALMEIDMPEFADEFEKSVKSDSIRAKSLTRISGIRKYNGTEYYASFIENLCQSMNKLGDAVTEDILRMDDADYLALTNEVDLIIHDAQSELSKLNPIVDKLTQAVLRKSAETEDIRDIIAYRRSGKTMAQHIQDKWN